MAYIEQKLNIVRETQDPKNFFDGIEIQSSSSSDEDGITADNANTDIFSCD